MRTSAATWLIALVTIVVAPGCDSIVGARCRAGLVAVDGRCVVVPPLDAGGSDGGRADGDAGVALDAGDAADMGILSDAGDAGDASASEDAGPRDSGLTGCALGELSCAGVCLDGLDDPANCGGCGLTCPTGQYCAGGACTISCDPPTLLCSGRCVDVTRDPDNCGACDVACGSGICIEGTCSGRVAGHVVVIGHDYVSSRIGMNRIAGNALFLARGSPVRVLAWEGGSTVASRAGTDAAIQQVATATGRAWTRDAPTDPAIVPVLLAKVDAFLIYAQSSGDDAALRALGTQWARALAGFLARGGVVVMFDTSTTSNSGTWEILDAAGLLACTGRTDTTGSVLSVVAPSDAVALLAPLMYSGERATVRFETAATTVVASDGVGPVVLHLTVVP